MLNSRAITAAAAFMTLSLPLAEVASAACTRLAFSVNDYGKDGPARDARNLLDKYIAKWASDRKITGYNVGPKEVTCELFLDVILFDEYTCKAAATVCWNGPLPKGHETEAGAPVPAVNKAAQSRAQAPKAAPATAGAGTAPGAPIATGSVKPTPAATPKAAPADGAAAAPKPVAAPKAPVAKPAETPAQAPAAN